MTSAVRRLVFGLVLVSCAYFVQGAGANQSSRYALVRALVEDHQFAIDRLASSTFDRSVVGVGSYSDKAPGLSLLAAIPYALGARLAQPRGAVEPDPLALHLVTLATVSLATAFAALLLLDLLAELGIGCAAAVLAVLGWVLGTNAFAYATLFYAHQLVAALIVIAIAGVHRIARGAPRLIGFGVGFALGMIVISEYPCAVLVAGLAAYACTTAGVRRCLPIALGAVMPLVVLAIYNTACFGAPWRPGYGSLAHAGFAAAVQHGLMGIGWPDVRVAGELLGGSYRGLLPLSPFLILALPGMVWLFDRNRRLAVLCIASFFGFVLLMSGFEFWHGGAAMGPRYLVPVLPFAVIPAAVAIDRSGTGRKVGALLVAVSIAICTMCVAVRPEFPDAPQTVPPVAGMAVPDYRRPIVDIAMPMFARGALGAKATRTGWIGWVGTQKPGHDNDAYNLGELFGLSGLPSLIPLALIWIAFGVALVRATRAPA